METAVNEELRKYCVYLITNLVNGKQYCGQTCQTMKRRWRGHREDAKRRKNTIFGNAINKYGRDAFRVSVLQEGLTREQANAEETLVIQTLRLLDREFGYNMTQGGEGVNLTPEICEKMKASSWMRRRDVSDETVLSLYQSGLSLTQVAEKVGMTFQGIWWRLRTLGAEIRKGKDLPLQEILDRYENGESAESLGKQYNIDGDGILRRLRKSGVEVDSKKRSRQPLPDEAIKLYAEGSSLAEIGRRFSMSSVHVGVKLREMGLRK